MASEPGSNLAALQVTLNRVALAIAVVLLAGIGLLWWRDRTRTREIPRWDRSRFVGIVPPADTAHATWVVVVNPDCMHCRARLAELLRHRRDPATGPALGVLLVDVAAHPEPPDNDLARLDGGVWWDSTNAWRDRWGHRTYGEVLVFAPGGALERLVGPESDPALPDPR